MHGRRRAISHLLLALLYFFVVVVLAGVTMILVSRWLRDAQGFWLLKQVLPPALLASVLALGVWLFDRLRRDDVPGASERLRSLDWIMCALSGIALFALAIGIEYALKGSFPDNAVVSTLPPSRFYPYFACSLVLTGLVQPILEELVFRGRLLPLASRAFGVFAGSILVSMPFALLHYSHVLSSFLFSLVLCAVAHRRGIRACIVIHASYNVCSILLDAF